MHCRQKLSTYFIVNIIFHFFPYLGDAYGIGVTSQKSIIETVGSLFGGNRPIDVLSITDVVTRNSIVLAVLATQQALGLEDSRNVTVCNGHPTTTKSEGGSIALAHAMSMIALQTGSIARNYVASGVVQPNGSVTRVAMAATKCVAADRLGFGVIFSDENRTDVNAIDSAVKENFKFQPIFVSHVRELMTIGVWSPLQ